MNFARGELFRSVRRCVSAGLFAGVCSHLPERAHAVALLASAAPESGLSSVAGSPLLSAALRAGRASEVAADRARADAWRLPLAFEPVAAGAPVDADFQARGPAYHVFVGRGGALLALQSPGSSQRRGGVSGTARSAGMADARGAGDALQVVQVRFEGASTSGGVVTEVPLSGRIHRLIGSDPSRWQRNLTSHGRVRYKDVYPGVDVAFYGNGRELEYDFIVGPGRSSDVARLRFDGIKASRVDADGRLLLDTGKGELIQRRPVAYQEGSQGRVPVAVAYVTHEDGSVGFSVGEHDVTRALVIDPVLSYATYFGGLGFDECWDIAVNADGAAYVVGETESVSFANVAIGSTNAFQGKYQGGLADVAGDAFVAKLAPDGSAFEWMTYLGGSDLETAFSVALAAGDEPVVGGFTTSTNFPVTAGAFLKSVPGVTNRFTRRLPLAGFVTRLKSDGSGIVASTLYGGDGEDQVLDVAVLGDGTIAAVGSTTSSNLPVSAGAVQAVYGGNKDGFLARFSADCSTLLMGTYIGGSARDSAEGVALDAATGLIHVVGFTESTNFPVRLALQSTNAGSADAFVAGYRAADGSLAYSTYIGGSATDYAYRATTDTNGAVWVVGQTFSDDFPVLGGVQSTNAGGGDGFALRLSPDGQAFQYATFLGGPYEDGIWDVAADRGGSVHFVGTTFSSIMTGVSTNTSLQATNAGGADILVARLDPSGSLDATFYGGGGDDIAYGVAVDSAGNTYLAGRARSVFFPVSGTNVAQSSYGGGRADGFVMKLSEPPTLTVMRTARGLELSWPAPNSGFVLESASSAPSAAAWSVVPAMPERVENRHLVRVPAESVDQLFRLRSGR